MFQTKPKLLSLESKIIIPHKSPFETWDSLDSISIVNNQFQCVQFLQLQQHCFLVCILYYSIASIMNCKQSLGASQTVLMHFLHTLSFRFPALDCISFFNTIRTVIRILYLTLFLCWNSNFEVSQGALECLSVKPE